MGIDGACLARGEGAKRAEEDPFGSIQFGVWEMSATRIPLRIAMIAHRFQRSDGQGLVNYQVARAALDAGHLVTLVTAFCAEDLARHPNALVVRAGKEGLPTQLFRNLAFAWETARWLRRHRGEYNVVQGNGFITWEACDVITAHFVHSSWIRSRYFPFSARSMNPYAIYQWAFTWLNAYWERRAFRTARLVIAVSPVVAEQLKELNVPAGKIQVVYNGVDTDEFQPGPGERESFGLPSGVPLALFVGEIRTPRKNLDSLLRAMCELPVLHLAVAADLTDSSMPTMAKELNLAERVHFLGKSSRIPALMRSVDLFVFPSRYEAHPLVVMEAIASGLPVIVSGTFGAADFLSNAGCILEDADDVAELTDRIRELLDSPSLREDLGLRARQRALGMQWSHTAARYLDLYAEVARPIPSHG